MTFLLLTQVYVAKHNALLQLEDTLKAKGIPPLGTTDAKKIYALFIPEKPKQLDLAPDVRIVDAKEVLAALRNRKFKGGWWFFA